MSTSNNMKFFDCNYAMWIKNDGIKSSICGKDIIDAIKNRNEIAILVSVIDENGIKYVCREHDEPRGRKQEYGYYWVKENDETIILYDEYEDPEVYPAETEVEKSIYSTSGDSTNLSFCSKDVFTNTLNNATDDYTKRLEKQLEFGRDENELPEILYSGMGDNIIFKGKDGVEYHTCISLNNNKKREVEFAITSFRGISSDAIHYYGKFYASGCSFKYNENGVVKNSINCLDKNTPKECESIKIEIVRPVTKEEKEKHPRRYESYKIGYPTNGFYTKDELLEKAKEIFNRRFRGEWELKIDDCTRSR